MAGSKWELGKRGRMTQEIRTLTGGTSFKTQWSYNSADLVSSMTYPSNASGGTGEVVNFTYLIQMLLDTVIGTNVYVNNTDYDAAGRVDVRDLGLSGGNPVIRADYTYYLWTDINGQGRLKQITSGSVGTPDSLQDLRYTYDAIGNVLTIQDYKDKTGNNPQTQTFTYDGLDRLTSAQAQYGTNGTYSLQSYGYDGTTGNLSSRAGVNYTYGDTNHKHAVTAMGSDNYTYDANGNQLTHTFSGGSYTFGYDAENHLVNVSGSATAAFYYDGDGNRVKGTIGTTTTTYIGNYFEWKSSTSDMKKYYYAGSTRVAMRTGSSTINYLLGDHLSSTAITTNSSGTRTAEIRYYPWGTERYAYSTTPTTYHFSGQRIESNIGLYFYGARWFDPSAGRFIQPDTFIPDPNNPLDWDRYSYVRSNPLNYQDPTGHFCDKVGGKTNCSMDDDSNGWWTPMDTNDIFNSFSWPYMKSASEYTLSPAGLEFIKKNEGFYPNLYNDGLTPKDNNYYDTSGNGIGNCTIGYGTMVHNGPCDGSPSEDPYANGISAQQATDLLLNMIYIDEQIIKYSITTKITQSQYDALVSYTYNTGNQAEVISYLNQGDYKGAADIIGTRPVTSNGVRMPGLVNRRKNEQVMVLQSPYVSVADLILIDLRNPFP